MPAKKAKITSSKGFQTANQGHSGEKQALAPSKLKAPQLKTSPAKKKHQAKSSLKSKKGLNRFVSLLQETKKNATAAKSKIESQNSSKKETPSATQSKPIQKDLTDYLLALKAAGCSKATIRNYKSDINQFLNFIGDQDEKNIGNKPKLLAFAKYQRQKGLKDSSIRRKITSVSQFKAWLKQEGRLKSEIPLSAEQIKNASQADVRVIEIGKDQVATIKIGQTAPEDTGTEANPGLKQVRLEQFAPPNSTKEPKNSKQNKSKRAKKKQPLGRLSLAMNIIALLLFLGGLGYFAYQQFGQAVISMAYPSTPTAANRILSFQGRLTNTAHTPIAVETDISFALYDDATGGNQLWSSNTCAVTPDDDGIFNVNLGAGTGGGSDDEDCGGTIADSVFTENSNVWLQVTAGSGVGAEDLLPRQPIRTVAYAVNAETVQGIRPVSPAVESTLLMLDENGELVLNSTDPVIKTSSSKDLTLEANSLILQTQTDSDGDIVLSPDGLGNVVVNADLILDGFLDAPGATLSANYAGGLALDVNGDMAVSGALIDGSDSAGSNGQVMTSTGTSTAWTSLSSMSVGNADTLDNLDSTQFLRSDTSDNYTSGTLTFDSGTELDVASGATLDVNGNLSIADTDIVLDGASTNFTGTGDISFNSNDLYIDKTNSRVGIGTVSPQTTFHVNGQGAFGNAVTSALANRALNLISTDAVMQVRRHSDADSPAVELKSYQSNGTTEVGYWDMYVGSSTVQPGKFIIRDRTGGGGANRLTIDGGGQVGIGSTSPSYKLDVAGDVNTSTGTIRMAGTDYGQYFINSAGTNGQVWTSDGSGRGSWADAGVSSDDQTLAEVLAEGNSAGAYSIDMNNNIISNIGVAGTDFTATGGLNLADDLAVNSDDFYVDTSNSSIGLGTTSPSGMLHLLSSTNSTLLNLDADQLTTSNAIDLSVDGLTTGDGINISNTANDLSTGHFIALDHTANYNTSTTLSGSMIDLNRDFTASAVGATIAEDAVSSTNFSNNSVSWSHTTGSGSDRIMIIGVEHHYYSGGVTAVSYNGDAATRIGGATSGAERVDLWYLVNPDSGTHNVSVTLSGSGWYGAAGAITFTGADQSDPIRDTASASGSGYSMSVNLTTNSGDLVVDILGLDWLNSTGTPGAGQSLRWTNEISGNSTSGWSSTETATGASTTMSWTYDYHSDNALYAAAIKPAASGEFDLTGPMIGLNSDCDAGTGSCDDTAALIYLNQQNTTATGSVIDLVNAGTGADIEFNASPILRMTDTGTMTWDDGSNELMVLEDNGSTGFLGIGVSDPSYAVDAAGDINTTSGTIRMAGVDYGQFFIDSAGTNGQVWTSDGSGRGGWTDASGVGSDDQTLAEVLAEGNSAGAYSIDMNNNIISNIGVAGTDFTATGGLNLAGALDVNDDLSIADTDIVLDGASSNLAVTGDFSINTDDLVVEKSSGNVNFGADILIGGNDFYLGDTVVNRPKMSSAGSANFYVNAGNNGDFDLRVSETNTYANTLVLGLSATAAISTNDSNESLTINANGSGDIALMTSGTGSVGIGTASPGYLLDVDGDINTATGTIRMAGTDYGQYFIDSAGTSGQVWISDGAGRGGWSDVSAVTDDNYVDSVAFNTGDGVLTVGRTGALADLTVDLDGRYLTAYSETQGLADVLAISNSAGSYSINMNNQIISNIGSADTDFTASGGLNLADTLALAAGAAITIDGTDVSQYFIDSAGTNGQIWTSDGTGRGAWQDAPSSGSSYTFTNGLTESGGTAKFGGSLTEATTISMGNFGMIFDMTDTGDFEVRDDGSTGLFVEAGTGRVGIGTNAPSAELSVAGTSSTISNDDGDITIDAASDKISLNSDSLTDFTQASGSSGSTSLPTFSFSSDINSGLYSPAADNLGLVVGGSEAMRLLSNGNVGLGITNPTEKLAVNGSAIIEKIYDLTNSSYFLDPAATGTALKVAGDIEAGLALKAVTNGSTNAQLQLYDSIDGGFNIFSQDGVLRIAEINTSGSWVENLFAMDQDGKVGIGVTTPSEKLDVNGNINFSGSYLTGANMKLRTSSSHTILENTSDGGNLYLRGIEYGSGDSGHVILADNDGYVGIGTASPETQLHVQGDLLLSKNTPGITLEDRDDASGEVVSGEWLGGIYGNGLHSSSSYTGARMVFIADDDWTGSSSPGQIRFQTTPSSSTSPASAMTIDSTGNVGIGVTSPDNKLEIAKDSALPNATDSDSGNYLNAAALRIATSFDAGGNGLYFGASNVANSRTAWLQAGHTVSAWANLASDSELLLQPVGGKVGIGTTTPRGDLDVNGTIYSANSYMNSSSVEVNQAGSGNRYAYIDLIGDDTYTDFGLRLIRDNTGVNAYSSLISRGTGSLRLITNEAADIEFATSMTNRMNIKADGKVGIDTTNPSYKFDLREADTGVAMQVYNTTAEGDGIQIRTGSDTPTNATYFMLFKDGSGGTDGNIRASGSGGVAFNTTSDRRLKTNLVAYNDALETIDQIQPYYYEMIQAPGQTEVGFMAQDLYQIYPYAVSGTPDNDISDPMMIDYSKIVTLAVAGVKQQQGLIEALEKQVASLALDGSAQQIETESLVASLAESINTNLLTATEVVTDNLQVSGQNIEQYIKEVVQTAFNNAEFNINPENLSEQPTMLGELLVENEAGDLEANANLIANADLEVKGNLTATGSSLLGDLVAENINTDNLEAQQAQITEADISTANINDAQIQNASISGQLYADSIDANIISGLQERLEAAVASSLEDSTLMASIFGETETTTEEYLDQTAADLGVDLGTEAATNSAAIIDNDNLSLTGTIMANSAYLEDYFEVNGSALVAEALAVGQSLMVGDGLTMGSGYIAYASETSHDLAIQPAGKGRLSLMANLMTLDESGQVTINGDLKVAGAVEVSEELRVKDTLLTNMIAADDLDESIKVQLAQLDPKATESAQVKETNFEFVDETGTPVATMSASGDLALAGNLMVEQAPASATESATLNNKAAGQATILAGETSTTIKTSRLTENSMIYVTPLNSTNNQVIYVQDKLLDSDFTEENEAEFTVGFDFALDKNVQFNWWIVN